MDIFEKNFENCDNDRQSIKRYNQKVRKYLTDTCDYIIPNEIDFILGPHLYTEFEYNGRRIGIFGERHIINIEDYNELKMFESLPFSSFLKSLLMKNPHRKYDFYIELDYVDINNQQRQQSVESGPMIYLIENELSGCFDFVKNCPYRNINTHYIDYRTTWKKMYLNIGGELDSLLGVKQRSGTSVSQRATKQYIILQNPSKVYNEQYKFIKNEIKNTIGIAKEFVNNPLSSKIKSFIYKKLYIEKKKFKIFLKKNSDTLTMVRKNNVYASEHADILFELASNFLNSSKYIMDIYFLARFGRKNTALYNIIYVGADHARTYSEFFEYIKAKPIYNSELSEKYGGSKIDQEDSFFPGIFANDDFKENSFLFL